ncbi:hypothetical protein HMPREF9120_02136 [Neisseria sp. oral taxon 020 str. F0370]|nr:hypothetical protein HMPREF9120_02136 [Neisseria sp. oral taxon 020 str. F0370]
MCFARSGHAKRQTRRGRSRLRGNDVSESAVSTQVKRQPAFQTALCRLADEKAKGRLKTAKRVSDGLL